MSPSQNQLDPRSRLAADLANAAAAVASADALVIGAGAGMGVDSGLPDFRGTEGFWRAYPPFAKLRLSFAQLASPHWFQDDPSLAWGFYGHRLELYRQTVPHPGFAILKRWRERTTHGGFVYTSNVDGQFPRAGFPADHIHEIHGAIDVLQCLNVCGVGIFPADGVSVEVDPETMRAVDPLPRCPNCGGLARPNILMFGDRGWDEDRAEAQAERYRDWLRSLRSARIVVIECGAGTVVPSVRMHCEALVERLGATLIRINPREAHAPKGAISLPLGALEALTAVDGRLNQNHIDNS